ncbi:MAG TPA: hypothetical protein EYP56_23250 [Planctomycetaceae bacterium]|nr:hypothetical protein [Planctomycetaceae bacterium]
MKAGCDVFGVSEEQVLRRGTRRNRARLAAVYLCRWRTGVWVSEMGRHFGGVNGQAVSKLVGEAEAEGPRGRELNCRLSAMEETLV